MRGQNTTPQRPSLSRNLPGLAFWLVLSFATASMGAAFKPGEWYTQLTLPSWTPPGWLFGPVWTLLYIAMAVAAWLIWRNGGLQKNRPALTLYVVQLILNGMWSWIFFGEHLIGVAVVEIYSLLLVIIVVTWLFWRRKRLAGMLMLPYILWVAFASTLNLQIWRMN